MTINKNTDLEFSLQQNTEKGGVYTNFYTEDKGSASIRIRLLNQGYSLDLTKIDLKPVLFLFHEDGSMFEIRDFMGVMPEQGLIQYNFSDNVIRHAGKVKAKMFLKNDTKSIHVANFSFDIKDSGMIGTIGKEIKVEILEDIVRDVMTDNAMGLLDDEYKEKINQDIIDYVASNPDKYRGKDGKALSYSDLSTKEKEDLRKNITDQAVIDYVIPNNSITNNKIAEKAISPEKTTFMNISTNLLDPSVVTYNKTIDASGNIVDAPNHFLSDYIPFDSKNVISFTQGTYIILLYDVDKKFMYRSGVTNANKFDVSADKKIRYFRISRAASPDNVMVNYGSTLLPFEKFYKKLKREALPLIDFNDLQNINITPEQESYFKQSSNIFNKFNLQLGKTIDVQGKLIDNTNWVTTHKIKVQGSEVSFSTENSVQWAVFDKTDRLLARSGKNPNTTVTLNLSLLPTADYFIVSVTKGVKDTFMMNYGNKVLPYEEYGFTMVSTPEIPIKISKDIVPENTGNGNNESLSNTLVGTEQIYIEKSTSYTTGETSELYNSNYKSQIDYVELTSNNVKTELKISYINNEGNTTEASIIKPDDNSKLPLTIENIVNFGYPNVEYLLYDPVRTQFKIAIKNLNFSNGAKILIKNNHTATINASVKIVGRYYV